jgi:hypothetical protein
MTNLRVHVSKMGTYHPDPTADVAVTVNDTRGYTDGGPSCEECGACECDEHDDEGCIGLSFAFVVLDGGETLCTDCAEKSGIEEVPCDCP